MLGSKYDATILGGFIIAWLNTLPETIFFMMALGNQKPNFAVGAISGSVIVVCTIAVGCCVWIGGVMQGGPVNNKTVSSRSYARNAQHILLYEGVRQQALILGVSCIVPAMVLVFGFQYWLGLLGIGGYLCFMLYTIFNRNSDTSDEEHEAEDDDDEEEQPTWKGVAYLVAGGVIIYLFSLPFIDCVVNIGQALNIAPLALAFFFAPVASEAPEILESISLSRKGKTQNINIAFSNLVGGTVSKTTLLTGILCLYGSTLDFQWVAPSYTFSFLLVLACAGAVGAFGLQSRHHFSRGQMLIALFGICSVVQFIVAYWYGDQSGKEILNEILEN